MLPPANESPLPFKKTPTAKRLQTSSSRNQNPFFRKKLRHNAWSIRILFLLLHSQNGNNGSLAQLNRAFDYGSKGYRFESYRSHKRTSAFCFCTGSLAQLNRASDYGSEGYRFESYRSHAHTSILRFGSLAQLNRASDYGSEGYRFESYRSHKERYLPMQVSFFSLRTQAGKVIKNVYLRTTTFKLPYLCKSNRTYQSCKPAIGLSFL